MIKTIFKRFLRGMVAGGISSVAVMLAGGYTLHSLEDLKQFSFALIIAFMSGAIMALDKSLRWKE